MKGNHLIETRLIGQAGLAGTDSIGRVTGNLDELPTLPERIRQILNIISSAERKPGYMICFIMYDITSNKVRTSIAKFLLKKGCTRVQKSIFMADMPSDEVQDIAQKLSEIQKMYDNNDSILIVPLSEDYARAMKIIGQDVDIDLILHSIGTITITTTELAFLCGTALAALALKQGYNVKITNENGKPVVIFTK